MCEVCDGAYPEQQLQLGGERRVLGQSRLRCLRCGRGRGTSPGLCTRRRVFCGRRFEGSLLLSSWRRRGRPGRLRGNNRAKTAARRNLEDARHRTREECAGTYACHTRQTRHGYGNQRARPRATADLAVKVVAPTFDGSVRRRMGRRTALVDARRIVWRRRPATPGRTCGSLSLSRSESRTLLRSRISSHRPVPGRSSPQRY